MIGTFCEVYYLGIITILKSNCNEMYHFRLLSQEHEPFSDVILTKRQQLKMLPSYEIEYVLDSSSPSEQGKLNGAR